MRTVLVLGTVKEAGDAATPRRLALVAALTEKKGWSCLVETPAAHDLLTSAKILHEFVGEKRVADLAQTCDALVLLEGPDSVEAVAAVLRAVAARREQGGSSALVVATEEDADAALNSLDQVAEEAKVAFAAKAWTVVAARVQRRAAEAKRADAQQPVRRAYVLSSTAKASHKAFLTALNVSYTETVPETKNSADPVVLVGGSLKEAAAGSVRHHVGPSDEALAIATRSVGDVDGEAPEFVFVALCDGNKVLACSQALTLDSTHLAPSVLAFVPEQAERVASARRSALTRAERAMEQCRASNVVLNGALVLKVSSRGRVVSVGDDDALAITSTLSNGDGAAVLEACLGFSDVVDLPAPSNAAAPAVRKTRLGVLGSTPGGSSLQGVLDALLPSGELFDSCVLSVAVSDKESAGVLRRAKEFGAPTLHLSAKGQSRAEFDASVSEELERRGVDLILLVGYMRILSDDFCKRWKGRIVNVHPSLLPEFAGGMDLAVHKAVIEAKRAESGCTVHLVTEVVDGGPVLVQKRCPVTPEDTPESLKARVQALETPALIEAVHAFVRGVTFVEAVAPITYAQAGVDIHAGDAFVERIKSACRATRRTGCDASLGGFGACFDLKAAGYPEDTVLVSGTDGVGTKLILAVQSGVVDYVGIDLVAMSVNDVIVQGAEPLLFLDYYACGSLDVASAARVVSGIAEGCVRAKCGLVGGETAEMAGFYAKDDFDLAGFALGAVSRERILPRRVDAGDVLIGLRSSGLHSNGFSLVRRILKRSGADLHASPPFDSTHVTLARALLEPTTLYVESTQRAVKAGLLEAMAHITGSGLPGNLPRVFDENVLSAEIDCASWRPGPLFDWIARSGPVTQEEMLDTFNCGVGMMLVVRPENVERVLDITGGFLMGRMIPKAQAPVVFVNGRLFPEIASEVKAQTYAQAGVDIHAGDSLVERIKPACRSTRRVGCDADLGGFGGLFDLKPLNVPDPILISGTDGVGTKLLLAQAAKIHEFVGLDLVAMSVNDLLVTGAEALFFLDYYACGKLVIEDAAKVIEGVAAGCVQARCALVGGETAEMPDMYAEGQYDLAGFAVGVVSRPNLLPRLDRLAPGDVLLGVSSSGVHSNGFSLVRKVVERAQADLAAPPPFASPFPTLARALLEPTRIYEPYLRASIAGDRVLAMAHITGSGMPGNIPRVLPEGLAVSIDLNAIPLPPVFQWMAKAGPVAPLEMLDTFNCGIGMVLIVKEEHVAQVVREVQESALMPGSTPATCVRMGTIVPRSAPDAPQVEYTANSDLSRWVTGSAA